MNLLGSCFMVLLSLMVASSEKMVTKNIDVDDIRAKCPAPCTIYVAFCVSSVTELCFYERVDTFTWKMEVPKRSIQLTFSYDATQEKILRIQVSQPKYSNLYMTKESEPLKQMNISLEQDTNTETENDRLTTRITQLEEKLEYTLEEFNNTKEELNSTKEELKSTKEDLLKRNEESSMMNKQIKVQLESKLEFISRELNDTRNELKTSKEDLTRTNKELNKTKKALAEQAEALKSKIAHLEANTISKERFELVERSFPFKLPPNERMINTMNNFIWYGFSPIMSDKFGKYETIDWNKLGGDYNWTENWMRMKSRERRWLLSPPLLLPREYGECVVGFSIVWEKWRLEIQGKIPPLAAKLISIPNSIRIDLQISISIDGQIIKQEREKFLFIQTDFSRLFKISNEMNGNWSLPTVNIQVFPLT